MKKLARLVGVTLLLLQLVSCKKDPVHPPVVPPPIDPKVSLTVTILDTPFIGEPANGKWMTNIKANFTDHENATSGTFSTPALFSDTTLTYTATTSKSSDTKTVTAHVRSNDITNLGWDRTTHKVRKWVLTDFKNTTTGQQYALEYYITVYLPNGRRLLTDMDPDPNNPFFGQTFFSSYQLIYTGTKIQINLGETFNPPNLYTVVKLRQDIFAISKKMDNGDTIVRTYTPVL